MTLIVAPATGAESYCSVTDADTYHAARGNVAWAALATETKEQNLRKATDYMVQTYQNRWIDGVGNLETDAVPKAVADACASLALRSSTADLLPDQGRVAIREKVDVIEVEYSQYASTQVVYRSVDAMLKPYLMAWGNALCVGVIRT